MAGASRVVASRQLSGCVRRPALLWVAVPTSRFLVCWWYTASLASGLRRGVGWPDVEPSWSAPGPDLDVWCLRAAELLAAPHGTGGGSRLLASMWFSSGAFDRVGVFPSRCVNGVGDTDVTDIAPVGLFRRGLCPSGRRGGAGITARAVCGTKSARVVLPGLEDLRDGCRSGKAGSLDPSRRPEVWRPRLRRGATQGRSSGCHASVWAQPVLLRLDGPGCICRAVPPAEWIAGAPCCPVRQARSPRGTAATAMQGANHGARFAGMGSARRPLLPR